jgi:tyrosinase
MKVVMRRNQAKISDAEWTQFLDAVLALKAQQAPDGTNMYDNYVMNHLEGAFAGHKGPAFFAWHRWYLSAFEGQLQLLDPRKNELLSLPYWDWTVDQSAPSWPFKPDTSTTKFLGTNGRASDGEIMDGKFAYGGGRWKLNVRTPMEGSALRRQFGTYISSLPSYADLWATLNQTSYDKGPFWDMRSDSGFRNFAEGWKPGDGDGMHNRVHMWVGGSMLPMTSPNDPVFWLHHCFVDKLWVIWQAMHQKDVGYQAYLPSEGANLGHNLNDSMAPFDEGGSPVTPADVLNHRKLGYRYDTEDYLLPGEELYPGQWITSASENYILWCWSDRCGVTLRTVGGQSQPWAAPTNPLGPPGPACRLMLRQDGNLVLYDPAKGPNNPTWESQTANRPVRRLQVLDTGYVQLLPTGPGLPIWSMPPLQAG